MSEEREDDIDEFELLPAPPMPLLRAHSVPWQSSSSDYMLRMSSEESFKLNQRPTSPRYDNKTKFPDEVKSVNIKLCLESYLVGATFNNITAILDVQKINDAMHFIPSSVVISQWEEFLQKQFLRNVEDVLPHTTKPGLAIVMKNYRQAVQFFLDISGMLTLTSLKDLHAHVVEGTSSEIHLAGSFRISDVQCGSEWLVPATEVPQEVDAFIAAVNDLMLNRADLESYVKAGIVMHHFVKIHPFVDGNGRMCRLLGQWVLRQCGVPFTVTFCSTFDQYRSFVRACESADCRPMVVHVAKCISSVWTSWANQSTMKMKRGEGISPRDLPERDGMVGLSSEKNIDEESDTVCNDDLEELESVEDCPLCLVMPATVFLGCCEQHACIACLAQWEQTGGQVHADKCPLCRQPFPDGFIEGERRHRRLPELVALLQISCDVETMADYLDELLKISVDEEYVITMGSVELGLVEALMHVALQNQNKIRMDALAVIRALSRSDSNRARMGASELNLVLSIMKIGHEDIEARHSFLEILNNLTCADKNISYLGSTELGLLEFLISIVRVSSGEVKFEAVEVIGNLSSSMLLKPRLGCAEVGLVEVYLEFIRTGKGKGRLECLRTLCNLSIADANKARFGGKELGLVELLVQLSTDSQREICIEAMEALGHLALADCNKARMTDRDFQLDVMLVTTLRSCTGKLKTRALLALSALSECKSCQTRLASVDLGLITVLVDIVGNDVNNRTDALEILSNLATLPSNVVALGEPGSGLLAALVSIVSGSIGGEEWVVALETLSRLLSSPTNRSHIAACHPHIYDVISLIAQNEGETQEIANEALAHLSAGANSIASVDPVDSSETIISNCFAALAISSQEISASDREIEFLADTCIIDMVQALSQAGATTAALKNLCLLSNFEQRKAFLGSSDVALVEALLLIVIKSKEAAEKTREDLTLAVRILSNLAIADANKSRMGGSSLGLTQALVQVARVGDECRIDCLKCLSYLTLADANKEYMGRPHLRLVESLMVIIRGNRTTARTWATRILYNLSRDDGNKVIMGGPDLGMVPLLIEVINGDNGRPKYWALKTIGRLAFADSNMVFMATPTLGLVPLLVTVARNSVGRVRSASLDGLRKLAYADNNMEYMGTEEVGLVAVLVAIIRDETGESQSEAIETLRNLTYCDSNVQSMACPELNLVPLLMQQAQSLPECLVTILESLRNISYVESSLDYMGSASLGLAEFLIAVVRNSADEPRISALNTIWNLSYGEFNKPRLASAQLGLVELLMDMIRSQAAGEERTRCLRILSNLAYGEANKIRLGSPDLALIELLMRIARDEQGDARVKALETLWNISQAQSNKARMAASGLGLVQLLIHVVQQDRLQARIAALETLGNLAFGDCNKVKLAANSLGLVQLLVAVVREDRGRSQAAALRTLCNLSSAQENKIPMCSPAVGLLSALVAVLAQGNKETRIRSIRMLMNFTEVEANSARLNDPELQLLAQLMVVAQAPTAEERTFAYQLIGTVIDKVPVALLPYVLSTELGLSAFLSHATVSTDYETWQAAQAALLVLQQRKT